MRTVAALPALRPDDPLGREIFSRRHANRAKRNVIVPDVFDVDGRDVSISVDRLDHVSDAVMAEIGDGNGQRRNRNFYGWAVVPLDSAQRNGRSVHEAATADNPYHAEIALNLDEDQERRDQEIQHANDLAEQASWRERPSG